MVDLELYRIFVTVAEELNMTRASKKICISQPAITKHIRNLEENLNVQLFERSNKGLKLTSNGEKLYNNVKNAVNVLEEAAGKFCEVKSINIGSHNHMLNCMFGEAVNELYFRYPDIDVNIFNLETDVMMEKLEGGDLDFVFSKKVERYQKKGIKFLKLGVVRDVFLVNEDDSRKKLSKKDIVESVIYVPRMYSQTVHRLQDLMKNVSLCLKNSSYMTILSMVGKTGAVGMVTREYLDETDFRKYGVKEIDSDLDLEKMDFGLYFRRCDEGRFSEIVGLLKEMML